MDIAPLIPLLANIKIPALKMLQKFAEKNNRFKGQLIQLYPIENMAKLVMQHNNGLVHSEINQGQLQYNESS